MFEIDGVFYLDDFYTETEEFEGHENIKLRIKLMNDYSSIENPATLKVINIRDSLPGGVDNNVGVYPEVGDNIIKLTESNSDGYYHYIQDGPFGSDWMLISTDMNGDVQNYNLDFEPNIPIQWYSQGMNQYFVDGSAKLKDVTAGIYNDEEVLFELYAGASNRNAGEIHVLVRDTENLEKINQIEISTDTFEDLIFNDNAFIEYYDDHLFVAYAPVGTDQDFFDGNILSHNVGNANEIKIIKISLDINADQNLYDNEFSEYHIIIHNINNDQYIGIQI